MMAQVTAGAAFGGCFSPAARWGLPKLQAAGNEKAPPSYLVGLLRVALMPLVAHRRSEFLALLTARAAGLFPTAVIFIHGGPGAGLGFVLGYAALLVAFFDVLSLALLFVSVFRFISLRHGSR